MKNKSKNKRKQVKSLKRRMNSGSILSFYLHRELPGDNSRLSEVTGYSESHISNVKAGRRRIAGADPVLADAFYYISRRRNKNEYVLLSYEY